MITNRTAIYNEMINFYRLTNEDKSEDLEYVEKTMSSLLEEAKKELRKYETDKEKIEALLDLIYNQWGFQGDYNNNYHLSNYNLPDILRNRRGVSITLGGIILYLAEKLDLPLYPAKIPTYLIFQVELDEQIIFIDPWNGKKLTHEYIENLYRELYNEDVLFCVHQLGHADEEDLEERYSQLAKSALIKKEAFQQALKYIENILMRYPDSIFEIRDRGVVLIQLGCFEAAIKDIEYFAERIPDDPFSELMRVQLPLLRAEVEKKEKKSIH